MRDHGQKLPARTGAAAAAFLVAAVCAASDWYAWLGWDHTYQVDAHGNTSGPYEPWQVIGLVVVLAAAGVAIAWRGHWLATAFGATTGLTAAVSVDWSARDETGLWGVGALMVCVGSLAVGAFLSFVTAQIAAVRTPGRPTRP